ncbi:hypothetical protein Q8A67_012112 [Cirrhinus molitorella]|uniref:GPCR family 3 nine cysteines domain-containing protein n=1 Tax=Cirrhinus molitorella TaxID=172907 RepID=A0AA88PTQ9_9TELE|nr:hypothetical protein Q8A67_012112 [Cirrhinus molitorella]
MSTRQFMLWLIHCTIYSSAKSKKVVIKAWEHNHSRSQDLCAVRAVLQALGRLHREEDLSAVMTVFHVQKEKSVMRQVVEALKKINFTIKTGDRVWFDSTGGVVALYEVVNWQQDSDGSFQFKSVGYYDASLPTYQNLDLNIESIIWAGGQLEKPRSVCSESCPPGTRKATQKGRPMCCYDCIPCAEGEISNETERFSLQRALELLELIDGDNSDLDVSDNDDPILDGNYQPSPQEESSSEDSSDDEDPIPEPTDHSRGRKHAKVQIMDVDYAGRLLH